jgi:hypothetical protein
LIIGVLRAFGNSGQTPPEWGTPTIQPDDPEISLINTRTADQSRIENNLFGYWVPQLASNTPGVAENGESWDVAAIWQEHQRLQKQFDSLLLNSSDYISKRKGYWISIAPVPYQSPSEALNWCHAQLLDRNHCYAKLITHDSSITDTVEYQK